MTRKIISLFLCATFALSSAALLASCSEKDTNNPSGPNNGGDTEQKASKIPDDLYFGNLTEEERTINIAYVEGSNGDLTERSLVIDDVDSSDQVDVAVQKRNQTVEDRLGVILYSEKVSDSISGLAGQVETGILAGDGTWDLLAGYQYYSIGMATKGLLLNLADLDSIGEAAIFADYIDLSASYWGTAYNDAISYNGSYYWITGDIALRYMGGMYCTFVNSNIYESALQATYGSIYDIAKEGKWTMDKMMEMAAICYSDDGDDIVNEADTLGFGYELTDILDGIAFACGIEFSSKDPTTGEIRITINSDRTNSIADKIYDLTHNNGYAYKFTDGDSANVMTAFAEGTVAFTVNKIFQSEVYLNELDNFYIIPAPKFDETQENYVTGIHDGVTIFGIPIDSTKIPQTAATLELLAVYSNELVYPAYYQTALKYRYTRDPDAAEMIELIHSNVSTDFVAAWSASVNDICHIFRTDSKVQANTLKRSTTAWQKSLDDLLDSLDEAKDNSTI